MTDVQVPLVTLTAGVQLPQVGFGVFQVPPAAVEDAVSSALAAGYRHIDTAALYRNEAGVGRAVAASGLPRGEIFVTTKVWNDHHRRDDVLRAFDASMHQLGLDVLDLYLIHWPVPSADRYVEAWRPLLREYLYARGYRPDFIDDLIAERASPPADVTVDVEEV